MRDISINSGFKKAKWEMHFPLKEDSGNLSNWVSVDFEEDKRKEFIRSINEKLKGKN